MIQESGFRKKVLIGASLILGVFIVTYFGIMHTYVSLSLTPDSPDSDVKVGHITQDGERNKAAGLFGIYMIPRSSDSVAVWSSGRETRTLLTERPIVGVQSLTVDLAAQKLLSKAGKDGQGCVGTSGQSLFSYSCTEGSDDVFRFADRKAGQHENQILPATLNPDRVETQQYGDGILSLIEMNENWGLEYVDVSSSDVRQRALPYSTNDSVKIYTNASSSVILVVNSDTAEIRYYPSIDTDSRQYSIPKAVTYTTCGVTDSRFACAVSEVAETANKDNHSEEHVDTVKHAKVIMFDTASKKQRDVAVSSSINAICLNDDGVYFKDAAQIMRVVPEGSDNPLTVSGTVVSMSCTKDSVLYGSGSSLFRLQGGVSKILFSQNRFNVSGVYSKNDTVAFTTFIKDDEQGTLHTYRVSDIPFTGTRSEMKLPYEIPGDLPIFEMDYDDDTIYIKPHTVISTDRARGTTTVDPEALETTKQTIEDRLLRDGLLDRYKLVYYFN